MLRRDVVTSNVTITDIMVLWNPKSSTVLAIFGLKFAFEYPGYEVLQEVVEEVAKHIVFWPVVDRFAQIG